MAIQAKNVSVRILDDHPRLGPQLMDWFNQIDHLDCTFIEDDDFPLIDTAVMSVYSDITGNRPDVEWVINLTIATLIDVPFEGETHRISGYCTAKLRCNDDRLFALQQFRYEGLMDAEMSLPLDNLHDDGLAEYCREHLMLTQLGRPVAGKAILKK